MVTRSRLDEIIADPGSDESLLRKAEAYQAGVPTIYSTDAVTFANMTLLEIASELNVPWTRLLLAIVRDKDPDEHRTIVED